MWDRWFVCVHGMNALYARQTIGYHIHRIVLGLAAFIETQTHTDTPQLDAKRDPHSTYRARCTV